MIRGKVTLFLILLVWPFSANSAGLKMEDYKEAARQAVEQGGNRVQDMGSCIDNLEKYFDKDRAKFLSEIKQKGILKKNSFIVLEMVGSAFGYYENIYISDGILIANSPQYKKKKMNISGGRLDRFIKNLSERSVFKMEGDASSKGDDGPCFFLTIKKGLVFKQVALFSGFPLYDVGKGSGLLITKIREKVHK